MNRCVSLSTVVGLLVCTAHLAAQNRNPPAGQVQLSFYMDKDGFYHLFFANGCDRAVRVKANYNGNVYHHELDAYRTGVWTRDITVGKAQPDLALLKWSVTDN